MFDEVIVNYVDGFKLEPVMISVELPSNSVIVWRSNLLSLNSFNSK
jgi:hypothetical protein